MTKFTNALMRDCLNVGMSECDNALMNECVNERKQQQGMLLREKSLVAASDMPSCSSAKRKRSFFHLTSSILLLLAFLLGVSNVAWGQSNPNTSAVWCSKEYSGNTTVTIPNGCTKITVEAIGGGGAGGGSGWIELITREFSCFCGGGGGGAYSRTNEYPVDAGTTLTIVVGQGGVCSLSEQSNGGDSYVSLPSNEIICLAKGGSTPEFKIRLTDNAIYEGAAGGQEEDCIGSYGCKFSGGSGSNGFLVSGNYDVRKDQGGSGAGGGAAGGNGSGNISANTNPSVDYSWKVLWKTKWGKAAGSAPGGTGGGGSTGAPNNSTWLKGGNGASGHGWSAGWGAENASGVGGGGGGARIDRGLVSGGTGAPGKVRIWFYIAVPTVEVTASPTEVCQGDVISFSISKIEDTVGAVSYTWDKNLGSNSTASWSTTNVAPGSYEVGVSITENFQSSLTGQISGISCPSLSNWSITTSSEKKTVTVKAVPKFTSEPTNKNQSVCRGTAIADINFSYTNATVSISATPTNLAGLTFTPGNGSGSIKGTPTQNVSYTVTATNNNNCGSESFGGTITVIEAPTMEIPADNIKNQTVCSGNAIQTISFPSTHSTITITGNPYGLTFDTEHNTISGTPTATVNYTVTATALNSQCGSVTFSGTITVKPTPELTLVSGKKDTVICNGSPIIPIVFDVNNTTNDYSLTDDNLSNGLTFDAQTKTITGAPTESRAYTITLNNNNGCATSSISGTVTVNQVPEIQTVTPNPVSCHSENNGYQPNGSISVSVIGGTRPYTYSTDGENYVDTLVNLAAGTSFTKVYVKDDNGCVSSPKEQSLTITSPYKLVFSNNEASPINCDEMGKYSVTVSGGTEPYNLSWTSESETNSHVVNNSEESYQITGLGNLENEKTYVIKVVDANGCWVSTNQTYAPLTNPMPSSIATIDTIVCGGSHFSIIPPELEGLTGVKYSWPAPTDVTGVPGETNQPDFHGTIQNYNVAPLIAHYTVSTIKDRFCPGPDFAVVVTVQSGTSAAEFSLEDFTACPGSVQTLSTDFTNVNTTSFDVQWKFNGLDTGAVQRYSGPAHSTQDVEIPSTPVPYYYVYSLVLTDNISHCKSVKTARIDVDLPTWQINAPSGAKTVNCIDSADVLPHTREGVMPVVTIQCGTGTNAVTYTADCDTDHPVKTVSSANECNTNVTYTYTYKAPNNTTNTWKYVYTVNDNVAPEIESGYTTVLPPGKENCVFTVPDVSTVIRNEAYLSDNCTDLDHLVIRQTPSAGSYISQSNSAKTVTIRATVSDKCGNTTPEILFTTTVPPRLSLALAENSPKHVTCNGGANGSATVVATGGTVAGDYQYRWSNVNWSTDSTTASITSLSAGKYIATVTDDNQCQATTSVTITEPAPVEPFIYVNKNPLCAGEIAVLVATANGGSNSGFTYLWNTGESGMGIMASVGGEYSVTATDANNCSSENPATVTLVVNPLPEITINTVSGIYKDTICSGKTLTLTASSTMDNLDYSWSNGDDGNQTTVSTAGTYTVTATAGNSCSNTATALITMNSPYVLLQTINDKTICSGGDVELNASTINYNTLGNIEWQWYKLSSNGYEEMTGKTTSTLSLTNVTEAGTYRVRATSIVGNCEKYDEKTVSVNVNDPFVEIQDFEDPTICPNTSTTLYANVSSSRGDLSFSWEPASGLNSTTTQSVTASPTDTITYTVVATATIGACTATDTNTVTVRVSHPKVVLNNISATTTTVCKGQSTSLTASYDTETSAADIVTYRWYSSNEDEVIDNFTEATITVSPDSTTTYMVKATGTLDGCSINAEKSITITVHHPQVSLEDIEDTTICYGTQILLTANATSTNNVGYAWTQGIDPTVIHDGQTLQRTITTTTEYHVTVTATEGTCTATATDTVTVSVRDQFNPGTVNAGGASQEVCYGTSNDAINAIPNTEAVGGEIPVEYKWYHQLGYGPIDSIPGATSANYTPTGYGNQAGEHRFTRKAKDQLCNDWTDATGSYVLTVDPKFDAGTIANITQNICFGEDVNIIGNEAYASGGRGDSSYTWYKWNQNNEEWVLIQGATEATFQPTAYNTIPGQHRFRRKAANATCQVEDWSDNIAVLNVNDTLALDFEGNTTVCVNTPASLENNIVTLRETHAYTSASYSWSTGSGEGATIIEGQNSDVVKAKWPTAGTGHLTLVVISNSNNSNTHCRSTKTVPIVVNALPSPTITGANSVCQSSTDFPTSVTLTVSPNNLSSYTWYTAGGSATDGAEEYEKIISWSNYTGDRNVNVKVKDNNGCSAQTEHYVYVNSLPVLTIDSTYSVHCNGGNDGAIFASATSGAAPYKYIDKYSGVENERDDGKFTGLSASNAPHHTIQVIDNNHCKAKKSPVVIEQSASFTVVIDAIDSANCEGENGGIRAHVESDGSGLFRCNLYNQNDQVITGQWLSIGESFERSGLHIGSYTLKVYAQYSETCIATKPFEVVVNDTLRVVSVPELAPRCSGGGFDVVPLVNITTGTTLFSWDMPEMAPVNGITGADAGINQTSVHDSNLVNNTNGEVILRYKFSATNGYCHADAAEIAIPVGVTIQPEVTITHPNYYVCPDTRELTLSSEFGNVVSNGNPTVVKWTFRGTETTHTNVVTTVQNTDTLNVTLPDVYSTTYPYTVEFSDGVCATSEGGDIFVPAKIELVEEAIENVTCYDGGNGSATVHAIGGTAPYVYNMNNVTSSSTNEGVSYIFSNLSVPTPTRDSTNSDGATKCGDYTVTITDGRYCTATGKVTICSPAQLEWLNCPNSDTLVFCCDPGKDYATVTPGVHFTEPTLSTKSNIPAAMYPWFVRNTLRADQHYFPSNSPYTITYSANNTCNEAAVSTFTITVLPRATLVEAAGSGDTTQTKCSGQSIEDIVWNYQNGTATIETNLPDSLYTHEGNTITISGTPIVNLHTVYHYTISVASQSLNGTPCNTEHISGTITIEPAPSIDLTSTQESCTGNDASITATASGVQPTPFGLIYYYSFNGGSYVPDLSNTKTYDSLTQGKYTVSVQDPTTACTATDSIEVTLDTPYPFTFAPITANNICSGTSFEVVPTAPVHGTFTTKYTWTAPQVTAITGGVEETTPQETVSGTLTNPATEVDSAVYTVTPITGTVCVGEPFTVKVPVNPTVVMNTPENVALCHGAQSNENSFTTPVTDGSMSYAWTNSNTGIGLAASGNGAIPSFTATNESAVETTASVTVIPTYTNGVACTGTPENFTITVNPKVVMNSVQNQVLCHGEASQAVTFGSTLGSEHITYNWVRDNESLVTGIPQAGTGNIAEVVLSNTTNTPQVTKFTVTPTYTNNGISCTGEAIEFTMTVNPRVVMNTPENMMVCHGSENTVTFTSALENGEMSYSWENSNNTIGIDASGSGNSMSFTAVNTSASTREADITVTPTYEANGKSCVGEPVTFKISVAPQVVMNTPANQAVCNGNELTVVFGSPVSDGQIKYNWTRDNDIISGLAMSGVDDINATTLVNTTTTAQTSTVMVTPTYMNNTTCVGDSKTFTITVNPSVTMNVTPTTQNITFGEDITPVVITNTASTVSLSMSTEQLTAIGLSYNASTQTLSGRPKAATTYTLVATANSNYTPNCGLVQETITINVAKRDLEIVINDTKDYDGTPLTTDYTEASAAALQNGATLTAGEVRTSSANVGTYTDGTIITPFATSDGIDNYNVSYQFTQKITPINATVTIVGTNDSRAYDGLSHSVTGYTATASTPLYNVNSDFSFSGTASASREEVGTSYMGLVAGQFANTNTNFGTVNFEVTDGYQTITPRTVTVAAEAKTKVYGNQDPILTATVTGLQNGEPTSMISYSLSRVAGESVGSYTITPAGAAEQGNYHVEYTTNTLTITPLTVNVAITGNTDMVAYDGSVQSVNGFTAVADNSSYDVTNVSGSASTSGSAVGVYPMNLSAANFTNGDANYDVHFSIAADGWLEIVPAGTVIVTISGHQAVVDYNGDEHSVSGYDVNIWVPQGSDPYTTDDFAFSGNATASRTAVGTSNMGLDANQFTNLNTAFTNVRFNVTDGYLTVNKANVEVFVTGNTDINEYLSVEQSVTGYTISTNSNIYNIQNSVVFNGNATASGTAVGIYNMGLSASQFANNNGNFNVSFNVTDGWLEIVKAGIVIVEIVGHQDTVDYNGTLQTVTGWSIDTVKGRYVESGEPYANHYPASASDIQFNGNATASRTDVGTTMMGLRADDFVNTNESFKVRFHVTDGFLTVKPLDVTVAIKGNRDTTNYDGNAHEVSGYTATASSPLYKVSGNTTDFVFSGNAVASRTEVGTTYMGLAAEQFTNINSNFGTVTFNITDGAETIAPAAITIKADNKTKVYDNTASTDPELTATVTGVPANGVAPVYSLSRVAGQNVGEYAITVTAEAASNPNYNVTVESGTFSITPAAVTIKADNKTKVYDNIASTDPALTATVTGVPANGVAPVYSLNRAAGQNVGEYAITVTAEVTSNPNYNVTVQGGTFSITPAAVTIKADNKTKVYDNTASTDPALTATVTGVPANGVAPVYSLNRAAGQNVGEYAITVTAVATSNPNYNVTVESGTFSITPAAITIKADNKTKVYDNIASTDPALTATVTGVPANGVAPVYSLNRVAGQNVGDYTITVTAAATSNPNYNVTVQSGTFSITPAAITIKADNKTKVYDNTASTDPALTATVTGVPANGVAPVYSLSRVTGQNVGDYAITVNAVATSNPNYTVTAQGGTFSITPATLTVNVTGHSATVSYNGTTQNVSGYDLNCTSSLYNPAKVVYNGNAVANGMNAGTYTMGLTANQFSYNDNNFANVTFNIVDGQLVINKINATVKLHGNTDTASFNGQAHTVTGYTVDEISTPLYTANDFSLATGMFASASRTEVGTTTMGLTAASFVNNSNNFGTVTFQVTDGWQTVIPTTNEVVVKISGNIDTSEYDGAAHTVTGYEVTAIEIAGQATTLYTVNDFSKPSQTATVATATRSELGTTSMTLSAADFANTNANFTNVTFQVTPGAQTIIPSTAEVVVKVKCNSQTNEYDGNAHTVTGYQVTAIEIAGQSTTLYTVNDFTKPSQTATVATATRTDAGTTNMTLSAADFVNTNNHFTNVTFNIIAGGQTITPLSTLVTVTVVGNNHSDYYDGTAHSISGYNITNISNSMYTVNDFTKPAQTATVATTTRTDAGTSLMTLSAADFVNTNGNFGSVTFQVTPGYQTIMPINAIVTVVGANNTITYDGAVHTVNGYTATANTSLYDVNNSISFSGTASASRSSVGTTYMQLNANQFSNTNSNFSTVTFNVTDGYQTITAVDEVVVTITGHHNTSTFDGQSHSVSGYDISFSNPLYSVADFDFNGNASASRTEAGTTNMGLDASQFVNHNTDFAHVTFNVTDGYQTISPLNVAVEIVGNHSTANYDGQAHTVSGYTANTINPLYNVANSINFSGTASVSRTNAGTSYMGLDALHFTNTNTNFNVTFTVIDGYQTINPINVTVNVVGNHNSAVYDGNAHTVSGYTANATNTLYDVNTSISFSGTASASRTNTGTTYMGLQANQFANTNSNFSTVTFNVTDGYQTITPLDVIVTVVGAYDTVEYDGSQHTVRGFTATANTPLFDASTVYYTNIIGSATTPKVSKTGVGTSTMTLYASRFRHNNQNSNFGTVTYQVTNGYITIIPRPVIVTIVGNHNSSVYDGSSHNVSNYTASANVSQYRTSGYLADFEFNGMASASRTNAGTTYMGLNASQFTNNNNNYVATFEVTDGYQTITPLDVTVDIVGNHNTTNYDGNAHTVSGYTATPSSSLYNVTNNIHFSGTASASRTDAGTTYMGLDALHFSNTNINFGTVTFNVTDGYQTINPINANVTIVGNHSSEVYDGNEHVVSGYTATASSNLYDVVHDFSFSGVDTARRTVVGTTNMGLAAAQFANTNSNFATVNFNVTDGYQTITPLDVIVTIEGNKDTAAYDGAEHTVTGYVASANTPLYDVDHDFNFSGSASASRTEKGTTPMNLTAGQFTNTNTNFGTVTFNINDGYQMIAPVNVIVTVVGNKDTVEYDGAEHGVSGYAITASNPLYSVASNVSFSGSATAASTAAGTTYMGLTAAQFTDNGNANFDTVTFVVTDGWLTITPKTGVVVTITEHADTAMYDGNPHSVSGYDMTVNDVLYSLSNVSHSYSTADTIMTATLAGNHPSTLTPEMFSNTNPNFDTVTFDIVRRGMNITKNNKAIVITSGNSVFDYDGQPHTYPSYTASYDGVALSRLASDSTKFELPTGDVLSVTNAAQITYYVDDFSHNNTFSYEIENGDSYDAAAVSSNYGTISINAMSYPLKIESKGASYTYDGYAHYYKQYRVTFADDTIPAANIEHDTVFTLPTGDKLTITSAPGIRYVGTMANTFTYTLEHDIQYIGVRDTVVDTLRMAPNPAVITITANSAAKLFDGTPLTAPGYTYTPAGTIAQGDSLVVVTSGSIINVGQTENVVVDYKVYRNEGLNSSMLRGLRSLMATPPAGYTKDVTDCYTFATEMVNGVLSVYETLEVTANVTSEPLCPGVDEGSVTITMAGGAIPEYDYNIVGVNTADVYAGTCDGTLNLSSLKIDVYTVTVTESLGNTASINFEIAARPVISLANSTLTCPAMVDDTIRGSGCRKLIVDLGTPTFTTTTGIPMSEITITNNAPADHLYPVGETVVKWVAKSLCGDSISCEQVVKVSFMECPNAVDYEGNSYPSVRLGSGCRCWTTENLKSTMYSDGRPVEDVMDYYSDEYPNTTENVSIFGHLYSWYAAADTSVHTVAEIENLYAHGQRVQGVCPAGWELPSDEDFEELNAYSIYDLKSTQYWINGDHNTNATGFNALPGGMFNCSNNRYENLMGNAYYWTCHPVYDLSSGAMVDYVCERLLVTPAVMRCNGFSIRCVLIEE